MELRNQTLDLVTVVVEPPDVEPHVPHGEDMIVFDITAKRRRRYGRRWVGMIAVRGDVW